MNPAPDNESKLADQLDAALAGFWRGDASAFAGILGSAAGMGDVAELVQQASETDPRNAPTPVPRIDGFDIVRELGRGGMGIVYEANQEHPRRTVAIKLMLGTHFAGDTRTRLFQREVHALARLKHPGICGIYDAGRTTSGNDYLVLELVSGATLLDYANGSGRTPPLTVTERLRLFIRVCEAINFAHQRGVIHRDLKPSNVLVDADGTPKVMDFGLARFLDDSAEAATLITQPGRVIGTLAYMSPEQVAGRSGDVDIRSDVYALGVILFELLTAQRPYEVNWSTVHNAQKIICEQPPLRPASVNRAVRGDLETIMLKALEKDPARRYQTALAFAEDIERYLTGQAIAARPPTTIYQLRVFTRRHKTLVIGSAAAVLALIGGIISTQLQARRAQRAESEAIAQRQAADDARRAVEKDAENLTAVNRFFLSSVLEAATPQQLGRSAQVMDAINRAVPTLAADFKDHPLTEARIRDNLGGIYLALREYPKAGEQLRRASDLWHATLGPTSLETLDTDLHLCGLLRLTGQAKDAERRARRSLHLLEEKAGGESVRIAAVCGELAALLFESGRLDEAGQLARKSWQLRSHALGDEHALTKASLDQLVDILAESNRPDEAIAAHEQSIERLATRLGTTHRLTLAAIRRRVECGVGLHRLDEAESAARSSAAKVKPLPADDAAHPYAAHTLAIVLQQQFDPVKRADAILLTQSMVAFERGRAKRSLAGIRAQLAHAEALGHMDDWAQAKTVAQQARDDEQNTFWSSRYRNYDSHLPLSAIYRHCGKSDENTDPALVEYARRHDTRGVAAPDTRFALFTYAEALCALKKSDAAEKYMIEQWQLARNHFEDDHPDMIDWRRQIAEFCIQRRPLDVAEQRGREWLAPQEKMFGLMNRQTIAARITLANVLAKRGNVGEADRLLTEPLDRCRRQWGESHPWTRRLLAARTACRAMPASAPTTATPR